MVAVSWPSPGWCSRSPTAATSSASPWRCSSCRCWCSARPAGVLADRFDNRRLLLATSTRVGGAGAGVRRRGRPPAHVTIWWIYALTLLLGLVLAVERPAMQAILFQLVGPELLPSAVAANGTINSVSRLIGPAIAGALIATVGVGTCFFVNAASYLVVIAALAGAARPPSWSTGRWSGGPKGRLREGFALRAQPSRGGPAAAGDGRGGHHRPTTSGTTIPSIVRFGFERRRRRGGHGDERQRHRLDPRRHLHRRRDAASAAHAGHRARRVRAPRSGARGRRRGTGRSWRSASRSGSPRRRSSR